jgi:PAS domain S-box-containing protein
MSAPQTNRSVGPSPETDGVLPPTSTKEHNFADRLLDTMEALVVVLNTNGRIARFNEKCEEVTGYSAAKVQGEDIIDLLIPSDEREQVRHVFEELSRGHAPYHFENHWQTNHWQTKEGKRRRIRWTNTVLWEDGNAVRVLGTGIDVTKQRKLERKVVTATDEERRRIAEELHDLLTPQLSGTAFMVEVLAQKLQDAHPEVATELQTAAERIRGTGKRSVCRVMSDPDGNRGRDYRRSQNSLGTLLRATSRSLPEEESRETRPGARHSLDATNWPI